LSGGPGSIPVPLDVFVSGIGGYNSTPPHPILSLANWLASGFFSVLFTIFIS